LRSAAGHHDVRRALGRELLPIEVDVVEEVHAVDDHALFGRVLPLEHARTIGNARVLLNDRVAGARRYVVPVWPDGRPGIIGEERAYELISIVGPKRVGADAHG